MKKARAHYLAAVHITPPSLHCSYVVAFSHAQYAITLSLPRAFCTRHDLTVACTLRHFAAQMLLRFPTHISLSLTRAACAQHITHAVCLTSFSYHTRTVCMHILYVTFTYLRILCIYVCTYHFAAQMFLRFPTLSMHVPFSPPLWPIFSHSILCICLTVTFALRHFVAHMLLRSFTFPVLVPKRNI